MRTCCRGAFQTKVTRPALRAGCDVYGRAGPLLRCLRPLGIRPSRLGRDEGPPALLVVELQRHPLPTAPAALGEVEESDPDGALAGLDAAQLQRTALRTGGQAAHATPAAPEARTL